MSHERRGGRSIEEVRRYLLGEVDTALSRGAELDALDGGDADGFVATLYKIVDDTLTTDYWEITLPNQLATSASKSPALLAYVAALNVLDADALLSTGKVRSRLDPAITAKNGIERHHLFPRAYLRKAGVTATPQLNQIANMALVEWHDNIAISDQAPTVYWPAQLALKRLPSSVLEQQRRWHALPDDWVDLPYKEFLVRRRRLMAAVIREAYERLGELGYSPVYPAAGRPEPAKRVTRTYHGVWIADLLDAGLLDEGSVLINFTDDVEATVLGDGGIEFDGMAYDSPSGAGDAAHGGTTNGWSYWYADTKGGLRTLASLREELLNAETDDEPSG
jgi:hypothetical protein